MEKPRMNRTIAGLHMAWGMLLLAMLTTTPAQAQSSADSAAIRATVLDYAHGWYTADGARMQRALHPELAKRTVIDRDGALVLDHISAGKLVEITAAGSGSSTLRSRA
jgi:hypothetical protein